MNKKWTPCTNWTKTTYEEVQAKKAKGNNDPRFLHEYLHNAGEWFVRTSVLAPTGKVWYA